MNDPVAPMRADIEINPMQESAHAAGRPIRLGFLGLGWIGRKRLLTIAARPDIFVRALADPDTQCLQLAAQAVPHHDATCTTSSDELLGCDLDGVVIATPSALHAEQAIAALQRGLAVFCQKPLAVTAGETARV